MSERAHSPLLPPNQTKLEATLATLAAMGHTPEILQRLWDAERCPVELLPWLAWALSVDEWDDAWTEAQQRAQILGSIALHRKKGTPWAVKHALLGTGMEQVRIGEHLQDAHWAEFDIEIDVLEQPLNETALPRAVDLINAYKAARSHLRKLTVMLHPQVTRHLRTFCLEYQELTIFPRVRTALTAHTTQACRPLAVLETQSIEIYPR